MTLPIDPIRRSAPVRRTKRAQAESDMAAEETSGLPVPLAAAPKARSHRPAAPVAAQLLGERDRRGLRGGPKVVEQANSAYARTEWSGSADRRAPKGGQAKKDV